MLDVHQSFVSRLILCPKVIIACPNQLDNKLDEPDVVAVGVLEKVGPI